MVFDNGEKPFTDFKKRWNITFNIFLVLTIIGFTTIFLNLGNLSRFSDPFNDTWLGIIINIDGLLSPVELMITVFSYFKSKS